MTITRKDVADLQPGDVVEYHRQDWADGVVIRGPLTKTPSGALIIGGCDIRFPDGDINGYAMVAETTLTVISRAPRPYYVNHDRTEPVVGDVVRDADNDSDTRTWMLADGSSRPWGASRVDNETRYWGQREDLPARLRLLVDGETGRTVP